MKCPMRCFGDEEQFDKKYVICKNCEYKKDCEKKCREGKNDKGRRI